MAVPTADQPLLSWAQTFSAWIATGYASVGLSSAQATTFDGLTDSYATALSAWDSDPSRSKNLTAQKLAAKGALLSNARSLYDIVKHHPGVTTSQLTALGVHIDKTEDTPAPVLPDAPVLTVEKVYGRQFTLSIKGVGGAARASFGASGAMLYSFVGTTPPSGTEGWTSEGTVTKNKVIVSLPSDTAVGAKVFFTANWYNARHVSPGCTPVMTMVGVEGSLAA